MSGGLTDRVRAAHGDAWQLEGKLREQVGGGAAELPGVRLMSSGLPHARWNNGDVDDPALVDLCAVRAWYADRAVPWGLRVPADADWNHGRRLFTKRCMGLAERRFRAARPVPGLAIRRAEAADLDSVVALDAAAFQGKTADSRSWIAPRLLSPAHTCALASLAGEAVGVGVSVQTDDRAGPSVGIFGIGVIAGARRRGVGTALTSWLVERGFERRATLAHLNPDTDEAARIYARLGFVETAGLDVYVDVS